MTALANAAAGMRRADVLAKTADGARVPAVTAAEMAEVDRLAVDEFGIDLLQMMEQAGSHLAEAARRLLGGDLDGKRVVVVVGPGNNGGGGLAAARHLTNRGATVRIILARPALRLSVAGRHHLATLLAMEVSCCVAPFDLDDAELADALARADLVVDALLGYNGAGAPRDEIARLVDAIRASERPVLSLDLPTGMDADSGAAAASAVRATATVTLALPKVGLLGAAAADLVGELYLADIGLPAALYRRLGIEPGTPFASDRLVRIHGIARGAPRARHTRSPGPADRASSAPAS